jgi:hypothetical protein
MKKSLIFILTVIILSLTCCTVPPDNSNTGKAANDPINSFDVLADRVCAENKSVSTSEADSFLLPVMQSAGNPVSNKWVFCDYYTNSLTGLADPFTVSSLETTNSWGAEIWGNNIAETGYNVTGTFKNTVRFIFLNKDKNQFHVYEYLPSGSDYGTKDVWFGDTHIFYLKPVNNGMISPGAAYLEIFPDNIKNDILEIRIEKTSYFSYRGIHAGDFDTDPGTSKDQLFVSLGNPITTKTVATIDQINWNEYNTFFLFNSDKDSYIHYSDKTKNINVRIFLGTYIDGTLRITSLYMQDFSRN